MFSSFPIYVQLLIFAGLFFIIIKSSGLMISAASTLASILGVSDLIIGLTVVALGTSTPELAVTTLASLQNSSGIALGNVVGSNIFNVGIILAVLAIVQPIHIARALYRRDMIYLLLGTVMLVFFCWNDSTISRVEAFSLCVLLIAYIIHLIRASKAEQVEGKHEQKTSFFSLKAAFALLKLFAGLAIIFAASNGVVEIATNVARSLHISEWVIGTTIVAAGTSLPELVTAIVSYTKKKVDIGLGNIIGSEIFNTLGVIGTASAIYPIRDISNLLPLYLLLATTIFLYFAMRTGREISRKEGFILLGIAIVRWGLMA